MPNHVTIKLGVSGPGDVLGMFAGAHLQRRCEDGPDGPLQFDFNSILPMPTTLNVTADSRPSPMKTANVEKYGYPTWYEFNTGKWGTKWNAYDCEISMTEVDTIQINFQTAWSLPIGILEELSILYPELTFFLECVEEGGYFSGSMQFTGEDVIDGISEDSDEWERMAEKLYPDWKEDQIESAMGELEYILKSDDPFNDTDYIIAQLKVLLKYDADLAEKYAGKFQQLAETKNVQLLLPVDI